MRLSLLFILVVSQTIFAQKLSKDQLTDKLADKCCECANKKTITKDNFEVSIGLCIIESLGAYEKDVEKHYGKDIINNEAKMEEMGYDVGKKMALKCTSIFQIFSDADLDDDLEEEEEEALMLSGKITEIKSEQFITFSLKEDSGKMNNFILLSEFDNSFLLTDKVLKLNDSIDVEYYELDLYDAKVGTFVLFKIVSDIIKK